MEQQVRSRRKQVTLMLLVPATVLLFTLPALLITPPGVEGHEGGDTDHNWGGHSWSHANIAWGLAVFAAIFYLRAGRPTAGQMWYRNRTAFLAWCAIVWGAAGFAIDGILTALVGDDTTWTHETIVQVPLQIPFMLGILFFGIPALVKEMRKPKRYVVGKGVAA